MVLIVLELGMAGVSRGMAVGRMSGGSVGGWLSSVAAMSGGVGVTFTGGGLDAVKCRSEGVCMCACVCVCVCMCLGRAWESGGRGGRVYCECYWGVRVREMEHTDIHSTYAKDRDRGDAGPWAGPRDLPSPSLAATTTAGQMTGATKSHPNQHVHV